MVIVKKIKKAYPGFLYVGVDPGHKYTKIGFSTNLEKRLMDLKCAAPFIYFDSFFAGNDQLDREIKDLLQPKKFYGEWFDMTPDEMKLFIKSKIY